MRTLRRQRKMFGQQGANREVNTYPVVHTFAVFVSVYHSSAKHSSVHSHRENVFQLALLQYLFHDQLCRNTLDYASAERVYAPPEPVV